jgi:PAS domain S-box-containing protein
MSKKPTDEAARLRLLADYGVMDTGPDETLDEIVALASTICETPVALVSLVDDTRQWFKAKVGTDAQQTPRDIAFCAHAIAENGDDIFTVPDARKDPRFAENPLVKGEPNVVFYAGAPLVVEDGAKLGTLCVIDQQPRELTKVQTRALEILSKLVVKHLQHRRHVAEEGASALQLQAVLASIADAVMSTDVRGRVTFMNPVAERLTKTKSEDAIGKPLSDLIEIRSSNDDGSTLNPAERALTEGRSIGVSNHILLVKKDATQIPVDDSAAPIRNLNGDLTGAVVVFHDITQMRALDAERTRLESELARSFDLALDLLATTENGYFTKVNPALERVLGRPAEEILAMPILDLVHPDDIQRSLDQRAAVLAGGQVRSFEARYRRKDGTYRWISWNATSAGGVAYANGRDVTDERAIIADRARLFEEQHAARESAEKAAQAMDQFLATVSHELRTPLSAILGWTRLLRGDQIAEDQRPKALATIERNAVAQAQLINDLLDISRIISGKMRLDLVPVELVGVIEAALDVVRPAADAKGVSLHAMIDPSASHVTGDSSRLQQVVWNLLANAVKFTPKGGRVQLRLVCVESFVEIIVADNGAGIAPDFLPHVFDRFRQADGASTRAHGGLGLGLAITKNIVELHGGSVRVESEGVGRGASFVVALPISSVQPEKAGRAVLDHPKVEGRPLPFDCPPEIVGLHILVVDDEDDAREMLVELLRQCGAVVASASSVAKATAALDLDAPAIVVSDLGMPEEDGYSLIKKIRKSPKTNKIPVIALTAYARAEDRTRALRAGFNTHVAKPIEPTELLAVIASLVERTSDY